MDLDDSVDSARMLIDIGCDTNGKLKLFLSNPEILELRNRFLNLKSKQMQGFSVLVSNLPLHSFYLMFGTRLEGFKEMLDKLESSFEPKELKLEETDISSYAS
ncbi:hypothetical protein [Nostoc sp. DSM 114167]|jgi:hypothetical protein|uniref:hypothetical protein n=1 Tax=Nostoc sp. DSM 114167 TaxID=3439050 RepID=UPI0040453DEB